MLIKLNFLFFKLEFHKTNRTLAVNSEKRRIGYQFKEPIRLFL